jgi:hypothetical protein
MLSIRITDDEDRLLEDLRQRLGLDAKVDVFRQALDYFLEHAPQARKGKG